MRPEIVHLLHRASCASTARSRGRCPGGVIRAAIREHVLLYGSPAEACWKCRTSREGGMRIISILHAGTGQLDPSSIANANLNANPTPILLGGPRSAGAVARLGSVYWWRSSKNTPDSRKAGLDQSDGRQSLKFRCLPVPTLGRVPRLRVCVPTWRPKPPSISLW